MIASRHLPREINDSSGPALTRRSPATAFQSKSTDRDLTNFYHRVEKIGDRPQTTLITLDDELIGDLVVAAGRALVLGGEIPPLTVVAIGFGNPDLQTLMEIRARYLTFKEGSLDILGLKGTGQGIELLSHLEKVIVPMAEREYGTLALLGYSLSASFALQAVFSHKLAVHKVGAISPSLWAEPISESLIE